MTGIDANSVLVMMNMSGSSKLQRFWLDLDAKEGILCGSVLDQRPRRLWDAVCSSSAFTTRNVPERDAPKTLGVLGQRPRRHLGR
ncbi:hypothetical protein L1887_20007 [Cichorium endivia]|nr:hypothetical protein L1887_20007 [Cichorium endivia]